MVPAYTSASARLRTTPNIEWHDRTFDTPVEIDWSKSDLNMGRREHAAIDKG
jgi:hypothetical protein